MNPLLNKDEQMVVFALAEVWNLYTKLVEIHPQDRSEFLQAIHQAQNIVMARPVTREMYLLDKPMEKIEG